MKSRVDRAAFGLHGRASSYLYRLRTPGSDFIQSIGGTSKLYFRNERHYDAGGEGVRAVTLILV